MQMTVVTSDETNKRKGQKQAIFAQAAMDNSYPAIK